MLLQHCVFLTAGKKTKFIQIHSNMCTSDAFFTRVWSWLLVLQPPPASLLVVRVKRKVQAVVINNRFIITHNYLTSQQKMQSKNRKAFQRKLQQTKPGDITSLLQRSDSPRCCATKSAGQIKLCFCFTIEMMKAPEKQLTQKPYVNHTLEFHLHPSRSSFNFLFSHAYPKH